MRKNPAAVVILALPGVVLFDLAVPLQVFADADQRERYTVTVAGVRPGAVDAALGPPVTVAVGLEALDGLAPTDTVVVPGFCPRDTPPSVAAALAATSARVVSVCTGAFALAAAGLLDGRRATTHWTRVAELARRHPAVEVAQDVLYIDHGDVATSAGLAAGIDLCLHLFRRDHGADAAAAVARHLVVAPHRDGVQAQLVDTPMPVPGDGLAPTCTWVLERLDQPLTVGDLAAHARVAPRTLARRFREETGTSPGAWLAAQRVLRARRLLETTDLGVEDVAARSGLGTAANLRLHLARTVHASPTTYRRTYRGNP